MSAAPRTAADLAITGTAVVCPVGLAAATSCAALRAGVSRLAEHEGYCCLPPEGPAADAEGAGEPEPVIAGVTPSLPPAARGPERIVRLALAALQRVVSDGEVSRRDLARTALLVALPEGDAVAAGWELDKRLVPELSRRAGLGTWAGAQTFPSAAVGAFRALEAAQTVLAGGAADRCVVLAADSYVDARRLGLLDRGWRIRSRRNPDGFLPGEAASALVVEPARAAAKRKARVAALLGAPSFATEAVPVGADRWSTGRGLTQAIRPLLEGAGGAVGRVLLCNMNGEAYPAREWTVAQMRLAPELPTVEKLLHPADAIGEVGAAMTGILVAYACHALAAGRTARAALVWVGSEDGGRAAAVVRPPPAAAPSA